MNQRWQRSGSFHVQADTELALLKQVVQAELVKIGLWSTEVASPDQDACNQTPHVKLAARDALDLMERRRAALNGRIIHITEQTLLLQLNTIQIDVGEGCHETLAYQAGLCEGAARRALVQGAVIAALRHVRDRCSASGAGGPSASVSVAAASAAAAIAPVAELPAPAEESQCSICIDAPVQTCVNPCGHLCMCMDCADHLVASHAATRTCPPCPICRVDIKSVIKTFRV